MSARPTTAYVLGRFTAELDLARVPPSVVRRARLQLLDSIGVALAASRYPFAARAAEGFALLAEGRDVAWGLGRRFALRDALTLNGMMIHGIEYEDTSIVGRIHPSASCLPPALGLAARLHRSGRELLLAYVAALESAIRIGAAANGTLSRRGFDATGIVGAFGAALAAGRILGLDAGALATAQGIVYSAASGNREFTDAMAWTKRFHPGWAAAAGCTAATLASGGFTAPPEPYEGRFGLYRVYAAELLGACDIGRITKDLGEEWLLEEVSFKPLPSCYFNIPAIDAARTLQARHGFSHDEIATVLVKLPEAAINTVCEPADIRRCAPDAYVAQFSIFHTVAAALVRRAFGLAELEPDVIGHPDIRSLAQRVRYEADPASTFPRHYTAVVVITLRDGRVFEHAETVHRGSPERPLSDGEIVSKFLANAEPALGRDSQALLERVLGLDLIDDANELGRLLAGPGRHDGGRLLAASH